MNNIDILKSIGKAALFTKGQIVFRENDKGKRMYIILNGTFSVHVNSFTDFPVRVANLQQGDFFGEMSLIDGWPRSATVIAEEDGAALVVNKDNLRVLLLKRPDIMKKMLKGLRERSKTTAKNLKSAGRKIPDISIYADEGKVLSIPEAMDMMQKMARGLRKMNKMLESGLPEQTMETEHPDKAEIPDIPMKEAGKPQTNQGLFPKGYVPINKTDSNYNIEMLKLTKMTCPYCSMVLEAYIPDEPNLVEISTTLDGRVLYEDFDILLYTNVICPNCNFTDGYQEFTKTKRIYQAKGRSGNCFENAAGFTGYADPKRHTYDEAVMSYYLRLQCLESITSNALRLAKVWIRLYWLYADLGMNDLANEACAEAEKYYQEYFRIYRDTMPIPGIIRINALLGELSYFQGKTKEALRYFDSARSLMGTVNEPDILEFLLKCQARYLEIKEKVGN